MEDVDAAQFPGVFAKNFSTVKESTKINILRTTLMLWMNFLFENLREEAKIVFRNCEIATLQ